MRKRNCISHKTDAGYICYNCYAEQKNPSKRKRKKNNEEERMQCKSLKKWKAIPQVPNKLLFAVPNGGSRHIREAANLKRQGVTSGVSDVILLIPKKGLRFSYVIDLRRRKASNRKNKKNSAAMRKTAEISMLLPAVSNKALTH